MAETVTITTFLELKDNMSAGLGKVEAALKKMSGAQSEQTQVEKAQAKAAKEKTKETEKAAKAAEKAAKEKIKAIKEEERARKQQARAEKAAAKEREREQRQIERARLGPKANPAARALEQLKVNQAVERARLGPGHDPARRAIEQDRIARRMAKAREREQREIAQAMLGPKYDPAARSQQAIRQAATAQRESSRVGTADRKAQAEIRAQERAAAQVARIKDRAKAKEERDLAKARKDFQRWGAQVAKEAERVERQKANAAIRELRRVEAARHRAAKVEMAQKKLEAKKREEAKADRADFVGKAGAAMFGPGIGGFISAMFKSPIAALQLAIVGLVDGLVSGIKAGLELAFDLTKKFVTKVFEVSAEFQTQIRRVSMVLVGMDVSPTYKIATQEAERHFAVIRDLAAKLPGETNDYLTVFSMGLPKALQQGEKSVQKFAEMASKFTAFGFTMGQTDIQQIGRDIARIMQGQAYRMTAMYRHLEPYIGMAAKQFNKLKPSERMVKLYEAIEKSTSALPDTFQDADALLGTMTTKINEIFRVGGKPLFESTLAIIMRINDYLTKNNDAINNAVTMISTWLGDALEGTAMKILEVASDFDSLTEAVKNFFKEEPDDWWLTRKMKAYGREGVDYAGARAEEGAKARIARDAATKAREEAKHKISVQDPAYRAFAEKLGVGRSKEAESRILLEAASRMTGQTFSTFAQRAGGKTEAETSEIWWQAHQGRNMAIDPDSGNRKTPKQRASTINDFRFSKFDIRQEFAEGFDPDRIAVAFASDLAKLGEMRMQSSYAPLYAVMGG